MSLGQLTATVTAALLVGYLLGRLTQPAGDSVEPVPEGEIVVHMPEGKGTRTVRLREVMRPSVPAQKGKPLPPPPWSFQIRGEVYYGAP
jgi:hypothetical protein